MSTTFKSVSDLFKATTDDSDSINAFEELLASSGIVRSLIQQRVKSGLAQKDIAESMGITQSAVSKIESSYDCDLSLGQIVKYAQAVNAPLTLQIGPPLTLVQSIKYHLIAMKKDLDSLAALANENEDDSDLVHSIGQFFTEASFRLMTSLVDAFEKLPASVMKATTTGLRLLNSDNCEVIHRKKSPKRRVAKEPLPA